MGPVYLGTGKSNHQRTVWVCRKTNTDIKAAPLLAGPRWGRWGALPRQAA